MRQQAIATLSIVFYEILLETKSVFFDPSKALGDYFSN